jgi:eukaryotic-like serine/threonine-protein kinase
MTAILPTSSYSATDSRPALWPTARPEGAPPVFPVLTPPRQGPHTEIQPGMGDAPAQRVGRYRLHSRLGRGGTASVYRAHDPDLGRDVAIKFLHAALCADEECRTRFLREARAVGSLSHPNIVVVHGVGEIDGRPFMTMELMEGQPLSELLEGGKQLPLRDAVLIGLQLARALEYAHARGVQHRDIKPGNIMLLQNGAGEANFVSEGPRSGPHIKVTDFGIAHIEDGVPQQHTPVGTVIGTPHYMSPEQTRGEKLDGRSDLFAAGIVLYQMLTGTRPFQGENLVAVAQQIAAAQPPAVNRYRADVPASLRRVVERCLQKRPAQRFESGAELASALRRVLTEMDQNEQGKVRPRAVPVARVARVAQMARRSIILMAALALVTVLTMAVTGAMYFVADWFAQPIHWVAAAAAKLP